MYRAHLPALVALLGLVVGLTGCSSSTPDEGAEDVIRIAEQFGIGYLPLQMIREHNLIEEHAELRDINATVDWLQYSGGAAMNGALLGNELDIASGGIAPLLTAWDETIGSQNVKGIACLNEMPMYLNTNRANIHALKDFDGDDLIALPSVEVSVQARTLQMAARLSGMDFDALDNITVAMPHLDGVAALLSGAITAHFTSPPFMYQELESEDPEIHRVINSYDVLGGPSTFNCVWSSTHFRDENPEMYEVFLNALEEAVAMINADKDAAAGVYLTQTGSDLDPAFMRQIVNDPEITFTLTPANTMKYAEFMHEVGALSRQPADWKDYFFDDIHELDGS